MLKKMFNEKLLALVMLLIGLSILYSSVIVNVLFIKLIALLFGAVISIVNGVKLSLLFSTKNEKKKDPVYDRFGASFVLAGATLSLGLLLTAFTMDKPLSDDDGLLISGTVIEEPEEFEPPISTQPPKTKKLPPPPDLPPPPPPDEPIVNVVVETEVFENEPIVATTDVSDLDQMLNNLPEPPEMPSLDEEELKSIIADFEPEPIIADEPPIVAPRIFAEEMPEFVGGEEAMISYVMDKFRFPELAKDVGIEGLTVVKFVINEDGSITEIEILRDPGAGCGAELVRVVSKMPKWLPGKQAGKNVRVQVTLPVKLEYEN